ncbi:MAG: hypothetical protein ACYTGB_00225 [Planctomycetota bacterium]|jgi:hypothetical protein
MADSSESPQAAPAKKGSLAGKFFALLLLLAAAAAVVYFFFPELLERFGVPARQELVRVSSKEMRCSVALPAGWTTDARSVGTAALVGEDPGSTCRVELTMIRMQTNEDRTAFAKRFRAKEAEHRKGYGEHSTGPVDMGGVEAMRTVFSFDSESGRRRAAQYVTARAGYAYILTCESPEGKYAEGEALFERIAASVRFE